MERDLKIYLYDILVNGVSSSDLNGLLDLDSKDFEEFGLEYTYNIDDIENSGSRKSNYSKSFKLPSTPQNNLIFKNVFNLNILDGSFNINKKQKCIISINNKIIVNGIMKMKSLDTIYVAGKQVTTYSVQIQDEVKDLFDDLGNSSLKDLDFSQPYSFMGIDYELSDHTYNSVSVIESQERDKSYTNVYDYCLTNFNTQGSSSGEFYPPKSNQSGTYFLPQTNFFPSIYVKAIVDRIFGSLGYTYDSKFLSCESYDGLFGRLCTIYNGGVMFSQYDNYYKVNNLNTQPGSNTYIGDDPDNNFSFSRLTTNLVYETDAVNKGIYISQFNITGAGTYVFNFELNKILDTSEAGDYGSTFTLTTNNDEEILFEYPLSSMLNDEWSPNTGEYTSMFSVTLSLEKDQVLEPNIKVGYVDGDPTGDFDGANFEVKDFVMTVDVYHENVEERLNTVVSVDEFLPDIKQSDFISALIKQFNLYLYPDKLDSKKLIIEPRPDFFRDGGVIDWTHKIDRSKFSSKPTNKKINRIYNFNQTEMKSLKAVEYYNNNGNYIGNQYLDFDNSGLDGTDNILSIFGGYSVNVSDDTTTPMYIPNLVEATTDSIATSKRELPTMIGIIDNVDTSPKNIKVTGLLQQSDVPNWNTISNLYKVGNTNYDLNFNNYMDIGGEVANSTYDLFWEDAIENLHNINQRLITMYVNLDVLDFLSLDFRNIIIIDGMPYIIQKVVADFSKEKQSKVDLIKAYNIDLDLYGDKINFYYANIPVGDIESGANKPVLDYNLFNSNRYVKKIEKNVTDVTFVPNSSSVDYLWFAMPTSADRSLAINWEINNVNKGDIGGATNLFGNKQIINYEGLDYNVYLANYQTFIDTDIKISFSLDYSLIYEYQFGSTGDGDGQFKVPTRMAIANDKLYVIDLYKSFYDNAYPKACQVFDLDGNYITAFGTRYTGVGDYPGYGDGEFISPECIAVNDTNIYIGDGTRYDIQILDLNGNFISKFGSKGQAEGELLFLYDMCINSTYLYVVQDSRFISRYDLNGNYIDRFGGNGTTEGLFKGAFSLACDENYVYVGDDTNLNVSIFDINGNYIDRFGSGGSGGGEFLSVRGISVDDNYIFIVDAAKKSIEIWDKITYSYISSYISDGTEPGEFSSPRDIISHDNMLRILDAVQDNIQVFSY